MATKKIILRRNTYAPTSSRTQVVTYLENAKANFNDGEIAIARYADTTGTEGSEATLIAIRQSGGTVNNFQYFDQKQLENSIAAITSGGMAKTYTVEFLDSGGTALVSAYNGSANVETNISAFSSNLRAGAGLNTNGSYPANTGSKYIASSSTLSSLNQALVALDTKLFSLSGSASAFSSTDYYKKTETSSSTQIGNAISSSKTEVVSGTGISVTASTSSADNHTIYQLSGIPASLTLGMVKSGDSSITIDANGNLKVNTSITVANATSATSAASATVANHVGKALTVTYLNASSAITTGTYSGDSNPIIDISTYETKLRDAITALNNSVSSNKYTIVKTSANGLASKYYLALTGASGVAIGNTIDIPQDQFLSGADYVSAATTADTGHDSTVIVGDPYIRFIFNVANTAGTGTINSYSYIPVNKMISGGMAASKTEVVEGEGIDITPTTSTADGHTIYTISTEVASQTNLGAVKGGTVIKVDGDGALSAVTAAVGQLGVVSPDGTAITASTGGVLDIGTIDCGTY